MFTDMVINGQPNGEFAEALHGVHYDTGLMRPYVDRRGVKRCTVNVGKKFNPTSQKMEPVYAEVMVTDLIANGLNSPVFNATTTLRKEEWIELDRRVIRAARYRLKAWRDLAASNSFGGFNGMSKMSLEHETMSDPGEAVVDFDGLTEGRSDYPIFQLEALPLPITHSDFWFSSRKLAISRNTGTPLDGTMAEAAGRRVAEKIEKTTIGTDTGVTYGPGATTPSVGRTSKVYGYTNFTNRLTYAPTSTAPTAAGYTTSKTLADVLAMKDKLTIQKFFGPFMIYHSNDWDQYMDTDYILTGGNVATQTLRNRLRAVESVQDVQRLDMLFSVAPVNTTGPVTYDTLYPFTMLMIQMTEDVCRAVNGMDITTVQWESVGGMRLNFKVMCIQVPQLRADFYSNCGILHATMTV